MTKGLSSNQYDKHDYKQMVNCWKHLDNNIKTSLLRLFSNYSKLFSGALGRIPGPPIKIKLKKHAIPFHSRAYTVPKVIEKMVKK